MPAVDQLARPYVYAAVEASGTSTIGHLDARCRDLKDHWWQPTEADRDPWPCARCVSLDQLDHWNRRLPDARPALGHARSTGRAAAVILPAEEKKLPAELKVLTGPAENSSVTHYTGNLEDTTMNAATATTDLTADLLDSLKNAFTQAIAYEVPGAAAMRTDMLALYRAGQLDAAACEVAIDGLMARSAVKAQVIADGLRVTTEDGASQVVPAAVAAAARPFVKGMIVTNAAGQIVRVYQSKTGNLYGKVRDDYGTWEYAPGAMKGARHLTADEARAIGISTEVCVFCATPIETKESLAAGYGPDCADKYGLPWGTKNQG